MLIVDTREKKWQHIQDFLEENKIDYQMRKLDVGDYYNTENPRVVIDRKADLQEVCSNLSNGKENIHRFINECRRAKADGFRFIVLVEGTSCKTLVDVKMWKSKYTKHTGQWLYREMLRLFYAYNVEWMFCKKNETAKRIMEILDNDK